MRKVLLILFLLFIIAFENNIALAVQAKPEVKVSIDLYGKQYKVKKPIMKSGRLLVPLKYFAKAIGANVYADAITKETIVITKKMQVNFKIGEKTAKVIFKRWLC